MATPYHVFHECDSQSDKSSVIITWSPPLTYHLLSRSYAGHSQSNRKFASLSCQSQQIYQSIKSVHQHCICQIIKLSTLRENYYIVRKVQLPADLSFTLYLEIRLRADSMAGQGGRSPLFCLRNILSEICLLRKLKATLNRNPFIASPGNRNN